MLLYIAILFLLVSPDKLLLVFDRTHQYKTYWCRNYTEQDGAAPIITSNIILPYCPSA